MPGCGPGNPSESQPVTTFRTSISHGTPGCFSSILNVPSPRPACPACPLIVANSPVKQEIELPLWQLSVSGGDKEPRILHPRHRPVGKSSCFFLCPAPFRPDLQFPFPVSDFWNRLTEGNMQLLLWTPTPWTLSSWRRCLLAHTSQRKPNGDISLVKSMLRAECGPTIPSGRGQKGPRPYSVLKTLGEAPGL